LGQSQPLIIFIYLFIDQAKGKMHGEKNVRKILCIPSIIRLALSRLIKLAGVLKLNFLTVGGGFLILEAGE
jgi:hypothetical protein